MDNGTQDSTAAASAAGPTLTTVAVTAAEQAAKEILAVVDPMLAAKIWTWYNRQKFSGFFGLMESKLLDYVFTTLFGADPGVTSSTASTASTLSAN